MPKVAIGIQARSTSERLPNKNLRIMDGRPAIEYIIEAAIEAAKFLNRQKPTRNDGTLYDPYDASVWLLLPENDPIEQAYKVTNNILTFPDENDVLSRYLLLAQETGADYIMRLTADCVSMPKHMISRVIKTAIIRQADYSTNVVHRTSCEGFDVEVLSARMLNYLDDLAGNDPHLREHVTLALVNDILARPTFYKENFMLWHLTEDYDFSMVVKTSVDTDYEFEIACRNKASIRNKIKEALKSGFVSR